MSHWNTALAEARDAVEELARSAEGCDGTWTVPRAPGKWTPAQVIEHVARSLEESANDMAGRKTRLPSLPGPVRLLARTLVFHRVLKRRAFPRAKTNKAMDPESGPASAENARERLDQALKAFETTAGACAQASDAVHSVVFGRVGLVDYIRFQELHVRHHRAQLPLPVP